MKLNLDNLFLSQPYKVVIKSAWILFLVTLPVTSFPFFPSELGGGTLVRPLSVYPLLILLILVTIPRLLVKPLPKTIFSFIPFLLLAAASTVLALLQGIEASQGVSVFERMVRALATLGLGSAMYFTVVLTPISLDDLRSSLRWLYAGFALALLWGSLQIVYIIHFSQTWFKFLNSVQHYISTRRLFDNRISGLTYEPNWFADQISFLLVPWLLASIVSGYSVFRWRWRWLTIEWFLLSWAVIVLVFTFSRAGLFIFLVLAFVTMLIRPRKRIILIQPRINRNLWFRRLIEGTLIVVALAGGIFLASTKNTYFTRLWRYWQRKPDAGYSEYLKGYFEYIGFGARFTYWDTAYRIYEAYPVMGVGLGNYAFYFADMLPKTPLIAIPEVERLVVPEEGRNRLITSKNFYLRILAETGLLGASAFGAFLVAIIGCGFYLWLTPNMEQKFWGRAGFLGLIAFALVAFSFDSFAIPNMWIIFGLLTAVANVFYKSKNVEI